MKIVKPSYTLINPDKLSKQTADEAVRRIARAARTCYQSEPKNGIESDYTLIKRCKDSGHGAILEHAQIMIEITCSRAIANEIVRHRIASYAQESTRYVDYANKKHELTFVAPPVELSKDEEAVWISSMYASERQYFDLRANGFTPELARRRLTLDLATHLVCTFNLRELKHIISLRADGSTGKPDPEMSQLMQPLAADLRAWLPEVFD